MKISVAVVGAGVWGANLIRNFNDLGALKAICVRRLEVLEQYKIKYPGVDIYQGVERVFKRADIDALVIATPPATHFKIAHDALFSGKHVFVEKPMVHAEEDANALVALAQANKKVLMTGHILQYHPGFMGLKNLIQQGEIGGLRQIYSQRLVLSRLFPKEDAWWTFAPHDISMLLALTGQMPANIHAFGSTFQQNQAADMVTAHISFPGGIYAQIWVSRLHPFKVQQLMVIGEQKTAVFDDMLPWADKLMIYPRQVKWVDGKQMLEKAAGERVPIEAAEPLRRECEHFLKCIAEKRAPLTDGEEGLRVGRVLAAGSRSLITEQKVVIDALK